SEYLQYVILRMTYPEVDPPADMSWLDHLGKLRVHHASGSIRGLTYRLGHRVLNSADYGVPQKRKRLFIVGYRSDLELNWDFPAPTHSQAALLWDKWVSGDYWRRHSLSVQSEPKRRNQ